MARPLRLEFADAVYHVTSRGLERRAIVADDRDRARWFDLLRDVALRRGWLVHAATLMSNHHHIFLRTPQPNLSAGMHDLNSGYVSYFNRRHRRVGPLLQGRFKAVLVQREGHLTEVSRYVHLNPVRAGLVNDPAQWPWTSFRWYLEPKSAPKWLAWEDVLEPYGRNWKEAARSYREFVLAGVERPPRSPFGEAVAGIILGGEEFVERIREMLGRRLPNREVPEQRRLVRVATLGEMEELVLKEFGALKLVLSEARVHGNPARKAVIYLARKVVCAKAKEVCARYRVGSESAVSNAVRKLESARRLDKRLDDKLRRIEEAMREK